MLDEKANHITVKDKQKTVGQFYSYQYAEN